MSGTVWIQNTHSADVRPGVEVKGEDGTVTVISQLFTRAKYDKETGQPTDTGFTEISSETFDALSKSRIFNEYLEKGKLVKYDDAPSEAFTAPQRLASLTIALAEAKARIVELESNPPAPPKVKALVDELAVANARIAELEANVNTLTEAAKEFAPKEE